MKKILLSFALLGLLIGLVIPLLVSAQITTPTSCTMRRAVDGVLGAGCPAQGGVANFIDEYGDYNGSMCCLFSTLLYVTDMIFLVLMVVVVILILFGAFSIMTAGGSAEGVAKGRSYIVFALVGVAIALLAKALPYIMRSIMGI